MSFPRSGNIKFPWKLKKVFIWYKVLIEISQEVEANSTEVRKGYLPGIKVIIEISPEVEMSSPEVENCIYLVEGNN